jgi:hypothetical protein
MKKEGCHEDYAQSPYEIALSYVGQSFETLEQIIGQTVKSEMPPNCQEEGDEAIHEYALFMYFNEHLKEKKAGGAISSIAILKNNIQRAAWLLIVS